MVFSSSIFVFVFLPLALLMYFIAEKVDSIKAKNIILLIASIIFYAWGGIRYLILILILIVFNHFCAIKIEKSIYRKQFLIMGITIDIGSLLFFKYFSFIIENSNNVLSSIIPKYKVITVPQILIPMGISFFIFKIVSYLVDVYKGTASSQKNILYTALYIMMFPHMLAGPIVRYADISAKIEQRNTTLENFEYGIKRFIIGFFKKVVIASSMGTMADIVFTNISQCNFIYAWLGAICYTLQIYYDFSGYSDMAIGLGEMFGFKFKENFNFPYFSTSIQDFWRRWHISLSSWFRDYVYIPLGGNRRGKSRTYVNLVIVFLLTGLWHGAAWQFIFWGIFHGFFLVIEKIGFSKILEKTPRFFARVYTLLVVTIGWVFFRADNIGAAVMYIRKMVSFNVNDIVNLTILTRVNNVVIISFVLAIFFAVPHEKFLYKLKTTIFYKFNRIFFIILWVISLLYMVGLTYNPFIYFKF